VSPGLSRRRLLGLAVGVPGGLALAAHRASAQAPPLPPTPACVAPAEPTPRQTAGPYFKPESPRRTALVEAGDPGTRLTLTGVVRRPDCRPVAGALLDFWQADDRGEYDNRGFRFRGHQLTDGEGRYRLETVVPGLYPGRTRHIHVRVQAPGQPLLTTQLYFPAEPGNQRDGIFSPALLVTWREAPPGRVATFDFVVR
jgi:protocatechuate 3,4-dioxygenase beta subunit